MTRVAAAVAVVYPRANLETVPSLVGAVEAFAAAGYEVDVLTRRQAGQPAPRFNSPRVRLRWLGVDGLADHSTARLRGLVKRARWLPGVARAPLARGYQVLGAGFAGGSRLLARQARGAVVERTEDYACVIGVDPDGLALARQLLPGVPLGYFSLELLLSSEISPSEAELKACERELSRAAAFVVVQDEARGRLLAEDNGIPWERLVLVPNAPPGPARRRPSRYWHARFDLPVEARVVLHSGSLGDWTGIDDIVGGVGDWPPPWVLVIHTRYDAQSSSYVEALRKRADAGRVRFSLKPVARDEFDALIDSGDVGIAFYVPTGASSLTQTNIQTIGLSSGKLAYYLRAGLPVVVNRAASVAAAIDAAGAGVSVDGAAGVGAALGRIADAYETFSHGARDFFDRHLDFEDAFAEVIHRVDALR